MVLGCSAHSSSSNSEDGLGAVRVYKAEIWIIVPQAVSEILSSAYWLKGKFVNLGLLVVGQSSK